MKTLLRDRVRFILKKPGHGRVSFSIVRDVVKPDLRRESKITHDERLDALNAVLIAKQVGLHEAELQAREIIRSLYAAEEKKRGGPVFSHENQKLLESYWREHYESRPNVDLRAAWNELARALDSVGRLSLTSADKPALERALNAKLQGNRQRRAVGALNQLLKYAGRDVRLTPAKKERRTVRYLSPAEFERVLRHVEDPVYRLFFQACFATGGRTGEVFALEPHQVRDGTVFIRAQMDRSELVRETKNRRERHTVVMPALTRQVAAWVDVPDAEKSRVRGLKHVRVLKAACARAFPGVTKKHCSPKDLRHSYAVWLLTQGVSIGLVAQSLGNSEAVCQENYAGFVLAPESVLAIKAIIGKSDNEKKPGVAKSVDAHDLKS
jgi:integrase